MINTLVVAEPAAVPAGGFIGWGQHVRILAVKAAQIFINTELHQRCPFPVIQLPESFWLIRSDTQVLNDISVFAPRGALIRKGALTQFDFESSPAPRHP